MLGAHGGPAQVIQHLTRKHGFTIGELTELFEIESQSAAEANVASGSAGPAADRKRSPPKRSASSENESDEESIPPNSKYAPGNEKLRVRDDIPKRCDWGGPRSGDDHDVTYLVEDRTGRAKSVQRTSGQNLDSQIVRTRRPRSPSRKNPARARVLVPRLIEAGAVPDVQIQ